MKTPSGGKAQPYQDGNADVIPFRPGLPQVQIASSFNRSDARSNTVVSLRA